MSPGGLPRLKGILIFLVKREDKMCCLLVQRLKQKTFGLIGFIHWSDLISG
jgi:hypothetical protein